MVIQIIETVDKCAGYIKFQRIVILILSVPYFATN